jgi:hypothetical protein
MLTYLGSNGTTCDQGARGLPRAACSSSAPHPRRRLHRLAPAQRFRDRDHARINACDGVIDARLVPGRDGSTPSMRREGSASRARGNCGPTSSQGGGSDRRSRRAGARACRAPRRGLRPDQSGARSWLDTIAPTVPARPRCEGLRVVRSRSGGSKPGRRRLRPSGSHAQRAGRGSRRSPARARRG